MRASLYTVEGLPNGQVSVMARPRGGEWLPDEMQALRAAGVAVLVSALTPAEEAELDLTEEATLCQQAGMTYISYAIQDMNVPPFTEQTFSLLRQLAATLSEGKHVVFHCRQGLGRSVLLAASVLVLTGVTPQRAFELLSRARGYSVPETAEQRAWVVAFSKRQRSR